MRPSAVRSRSWRITADSRHPRRKSIRKARLLPGFLFCLCPVRADRTGQFFRLSAAIWSSFPARPLRAAPFSAATAADRPLPFCKQSIRRHELPARWQPKQNSYTPHILHLHNYRLVSLSHIFGGIAQLGGRSGAARFQGGRTGQAGAGQRRAGSNHGYNGKPPTRRDRRGAPDRSAPARRRCPTA